MKTVPRMRPAKRHLTLALSLFILAGQVPPAFAQQVQIVPALKSEDVLPRKPAGRAPFRIETIPVGRDAQLLTVFGKLDDADPENDRLRHVWMLTYTRPTTMQRVASAIPFLYGRVGDKKSVNGKGVPPSVIDLADPKQDLRHRFMWLALQNVVFNPYGV